MRNHIHCTGERKDRQVISSYIAIQDGIQCQNKTASFLWSSIFGCFGFTDTYMDQGISQVQMFLIHMRHQDEIVILLQILLENLQLIIGLPLLAPSSPDL